MDINISAKKEHIGEIERPIQTIKERWRVHNARLPYKKKPKIIVRTIGYHCIKWLNSSPIKMVSKNISPRKLMTRKDVQYGKDCQ